MKEWMPFFSVEIYEEAPWYIKYLLGPMLGMVQLMLIVFLFTLAAKLAWMI